MVLTRSQSNTIQRDALIFVDVSGSTSEHTTSRNLAKKVNSIISGYNTVSLYTSCHTLKQHYFRNPDVTVPSNVFAFGGLSAVYDNLLDAIRHRFAYDSDTPCDVYVISDLDDNMSEHDDTHVRRLIRNIHFWNVEYIHPIDVGK